MNVSQEIEPNVADALQSAILTKCLPSTVTAKSTKLIPEGAKVAFDLRVTLKGVLTRAEGYDAKPTSILLSKAVIARLLRSLGATKASAKKALLEAAEAALEQGSDRQSLGKALVLEDRELLLAIDEVDQDILERLPKTRRSGAVKVAATVNYTKTKLEPQSF